jgi:uncharacterized membrane protein YphA (DoxX/SURF4 family)
VLAQLLRPGELLARGALLMGRVPLPAVGVVVRVAAAAIWLFTGIAKITGGLETFREAVDRYQLLPHFLVAPFAYTLPFVEVLVGLYLLLGLLTRVAGGVACVLMVMFLIAIGQAWARGLVIDCGCAGVALQEKVGPWAFVRDLGLGIPSLLMLIWPARTLSLDRRLFDSPDLFRRDRPRV